MDVKINVKVHSVGEYNFEANNVDFDGLKEKMTDYLKSLDIDFPGLIMDAALKNSK